MKRTLHKELRALLDFRHRQREQLPEAHAQGAGVIARPSFYISRDFLQRHLNNPLLKPERAHARFGIEPAYYTAIQAAV